MRIGPVHWGSYSGEQLERVMAVLLLQERPTSWRRSPSSGDGGVDVVEPVEGGYHVFQIKGFVGRLDSSRRAQVSDSIERVASDPRLEGPVVRWSLVVPIDPTSGEEQWFSGLVKNYGFHSNWLGDSFWNSEAAKYPFVLEYFFENGKQVVQNRVRTLAELLQAPMNAPEPGDLVETLGDLHKLLNESDPHYRYEMQLSDRPVPLQAKPNLVVSRSVSDGVSVVTTDVIAKYPQATEDRPIEIKVNLVVRDPKRDIDIEDDVRAMFDYGRAVELPEGSLRELRADLPGGLQGGAPEAAGRLGPAVIQGFSPQRLRFRVQGGGGADVAMILADFTHATQGSRGTEWHGVESNGSFEIRLTIDAVSPGASSDPNERIRSNLHIHNLRPWVAPAARILPSFEFLEALRGPNLLLCEMEFGALIANAPLPADPMLSISPELMQLLRDVASIQTHTPLPLTVPEQLTHLEVSQANRVQRLLAGEVVTDSWAYAEILLSRDIAEGLDLTIGAVNDELALEEELVLNLGTTTIGQLGRVVQRLNGARVVSSEPQESNLLVKVECAGGLLEEWIDH